MHVSVIAWKTTFAALLWYHIVPGTYYSQGLEDGQMLLSSRDVGQLQVQLDQQGERRKNQQIFDKEHKITRKSF